MTGKAETRQILVITRHEHNIDKNGGRKPARGGGK